MHAVRRLITGGISGLAAALVGALLVAWTTGLTWGEAPHTTRIHLALGLAYVRLDWTEGDAGGAVRQAPTVVSSLRGTRTHYTEVTCSYRGRGGTTITCTQHTMIICGWSGGQWTC
jgi:hypothetical protein